VGPQLAAEYLDQPEITMPTADNGDLQLALAAAVRGREGDPVIRPLVLGLGAKHIVTALGSKAPAGSIGKSSRAEEWPRRLISGTRAQRREARSYSTLWGRDRREETDVGSLHTSGLRGALA
jgi:hypothetical protein